MMELRWKGRQVILLTGRQGGASPPSPNFLIYLFSLHRLCSVKGCRSCCLRPNFPIQNMTRGCSQSAWEGTAGCETAQ